MKKTRKKKSKQTNDWKFQVKMAKRYISKCGENDMTLKETKQMSLDGKVTHLKMAHHKKKKN